MTSCNNGYALRDHLGTPIHLHYIAYGSEEIGEGTELGIELIPKLIVCQSFTHVVNNRSLKSSMPLLSVGNSLAIFQLERNRRLLLLRHRIASCCASQNVYDDTVRGYLKIL